MKPYYAILYSGQLKKPVSFVKVFAKSRRKAYEEAEDNASNIIVLTNEELEELIFYILGELS